MTPAPSPHSSDPSGPPEALRRELLRFATYQREAAVLKAHGISPSSVGAVGAVLLKGLSPGSSLKMLPEQLSALLKIDVSASRALAIDLADKVLNQLATPLPAFDRESVLTQWRGSNTPPAAREYQPILKRTAASVSADFLQDEKEIEGMRQGKKTILESKPAQSVEEIVARICRHPLFGFKEPALQERCRQIVESRVRQVRDPLAARRRFAESADRSGLGVTGQQLDQMMDMLEREIKEYERFEHEKLTQRRQAKGEEKRVEQVQKREQQQKEERLLNRRYVHITGRLPEESISPISSGARVSAALSTQMQLQQDSGKIDVEKVKHIVQQASRTSSTPSLPVPAKMEDVKFTRRLSGPVDELARLSLTDFRRLSRDPEQAMTKIRDQIELLQEEGYERRAQGIQAWRSSPLYRQYMALAEDAIWKGGTLTQAMEEKRKKGEETFTDEELHALMRLSADIHF